LFLEGAAVAAKTEVDLGDAFASGGVVVVFSNIGLLSKMGLGRFKSPLIPQADRQKTALTVRHKALAEYAFLAVLLIVGRCI